MRQKTKKTLDKTKKITGKIFRIIWIIFGVLILFITGSLYLKMYSAQGLGVIAVAVLFAIGVYIFFIYLGITILFLLIRWIIKIIKNKKRRK